jgi:hypothetical protein
MTVATNRPYDEVIRQIARRTLSSDSVASTCTLAQPTGKSRTPPSSTIYSRRIGFQESLNAYYDNDVSPELRKRLWYSSKDIAGFKSDCSELSKSFRTAESYSEDPESWPNCLLEFYSALSDAEDISDVEAVLAEVDFAVPSVALGLERSVVRAINYDKAWRRNQVASEVSFWQRAALADESTRAENIRLVSRTVTRAARLYAHAAACLLALEE